MRALGPRSQLIVFVAAVLVPCAVLVVLSVRVAGQDRELRAKRHADDHHRVAVRARDALLASLDSIRSGELTTALEPRQPYRYPETVFVGWIEEGHLALPWEPDRDQTVHRARESLARPPFDTVLRGCNPQAVPCFEHAVAAATNPTQAAYGRWLLAQALDAGGQSGRADSLYRTLLNTAPEATDPDGIPIGLHAALSILQRGSTDPRIVPTVESALSLRPWLSPLSSYVAAEIARRVQSSALRRRTDAIVHLLEQAESLQSEFPRLQEAWRGHIPPAWIAFGEETWLLAPAGTVESGTPVIAVRGGDLFARIAPPGTRFADFREPGGEMLGEGISGVKLLMPAETSADSGAGDLERQLFYLAMAVAVSVTMFAAWLLWRDLKREMGLSELRAQFVASVSHELKTPLTSIRMFAETMQMGRCTDPEMQSQYLGTIVNECERLSRLVDGVLLFARSENDQKIFHFRAVQPLDAVRAAVRALEYPMAEQGFHLHLDLEEKLPAIRADRDTMEQAVLNLLSNAMKFSGDAREIHLGLHRENGHIRLDVKDSGIGIAPEEQAHVFEKFYRARTPETRAIPGAGLGLALVSQIMKAHGGSCSVSSTPGKGSTFTLRFPLQEANS